MPRYAAKASPIRPLPLDGAGTLEGVILSALTVFGLLVTFVIFVVQCIPSRGHRSTSPSFPLNILILFGIVLLLCSNFAFILSATEAICSTRRSVPGIAYSTILAGLLVEVVDRWRRYSENKPLREVSSCHPFGLLMSSLALILVQAFLATGWLLLVASMIEPLEDFENTNSPLKSLISDEDKDLNEPQWMAPLWRCSPASNFEAHFLLSMSYNLLLLIATSLLVLCIRRQGRRQEVFMGMGKKKERRSQIGVEGGIIVCCGIMWVIWVVSIITSLMLPYKRREVVIIVADFLSAVIVLCTLFMRDTYATSRKKIKHKEEAMTVAAMPGLNNRFPYPQPIFSISHFKAQHVR
ncbi:hypothetical protein J437_LFUL010973 [Ladona fulva]|uniref:G-protein coupled receptors family 3 profile domain-containing protein n=1 Tax=Ladona fulva TaxID=123851 RepID=A0A8K0K3U0_LADFU|nr:hypothetical protein J437_LFUL010973 [Ladona fulva]